MEGYLEKVEDAEEFLDRDQSQLTKFSNEAFSLYVKILRLGLLPDICNSIYLNNYFNSLFFVKQNIFEIDISMRDLQNLKILRLPQNKITAVANVPPFLEELDLTSNLVSEIRGPVNGNLLHLGLAYNQVCSDQMRPITKYYPGLFSLNLSFNRLEDLKDVCRELSVLDGLRIATFYGNAISMQENYRPYVL